MPLRRARAALFILSAATALLAAACGSSSSSASPTSSSGGTTGTLTIGLQTDLAFAPLYIIEQEGWLKQALPNVNVKYDVLSSGSAIQTGVLSGNIDVGAVGIAPFIIGQAKGVPWKLLVSLGEHDQSLVAKPPVSSFPDLQNARIGVVSPTSVEAIALQKMAQSKLGKASALNSGLVTLTQPQALQAFQAGSVQAFVAVAPYTGEAQAAGGHVLDTSYQEFGPSTLDSLVVSTSYYDQHPAIAKALVTQIKRAEQLLTNQPAQAAQILAAYFKGAQSAATLQTDLAVPGENWDSTPHGYLAYAKFIHDEGLSDSAATSMAPLEEPTLSATPGN